MPITKESALPEATPGYVRTEAGDLIPDYDGTLIDIAEGDVVQGVVVKIDRDEVLVDIGYKSEGVIPLRELTHSPDSHPDQIVSMGDEISSMVLQKEDKEGRLILSYKRAEYERSWKKLESVWQTGETISGRAVETVRGGLIVDVGLRGFLPASLIDLRRVKELKEFLGQQIECKIIEMDRSRNNVVLSRRAVLLTEQKEQRTQAIDDLQPGNKISGKISSIVPFGAFVDLNGIDGLIHISELSWEHVAHPSEVVAVGDTVEVVIDDVDKSRQRISLSLKQTLEDPWRNAASKFAADQVTSGKITKLVSFGAFVELASGLEGLVHISEFSSRHIENPREVVSEGDVTEVKILDIDYDRRRISLSIKDANPEEADEDAAEEPAAEAVEEPQDTVETAETVEEEAQAAVEPVETVEEAVTPEPESEPAAETIETEAEEVVQEAEVEIEKTAGPDSEEDLAPAAVATAADGSLESVLEEMKKEMGAKTKTRSR